MLSCGNLLSRHRLLLPFVRVQALPLSWSSGSLGVAASVRMGCWDVWAWFQSRVFLLLILTYKPAHGRCLVMFFSCVLHTVSLQERKNPFHLNGDASRFAEDFSGVWRSGGAAALGKPGCTLGPVLKPYLASIGFSPPGALFPLVVFPTNVQLLICPGVFYSHHSLFDGSTP